MKGKKEVHVSPHMSQEQIKKWINGCEQLLQDCDNSAGKKILEEFVKDFKTALEHKKKFDLEAEREGARLYYWTHREKCLEVVRRIKARDPEKYRQYSREASRKRREKAKKERSESC